MRLWSVHPKYLDGKGLVALWREGLLAQSCLIGKSKGYSNHSQLIRFKQSKDQVSAISYYLDEVYQEAYNRSYKFNKSKIIPLSKEIPLIKVTRKQVEYEFNHLRNKLMIRAPHLVHLIPTNITQKDIHPLFLLVEGEIETWEKI